MNESAKTRPILSRISRDQAVDKKVLRRDPARPTREAPLDSHFDGNPPVPSRPIQDIDQTFDEINDDLKLHDLNSNKVAILLDYYNLNQDVCLASIETLKEGFLETQKELLKKLNSDLEEIAKIKFEEYQRELEELKSQRKQQFEQDFDLLSLRHYEEIHAYVTDIDTKQKELQDQIDNFHLNQAMEYLQQHHHECHEQRDLLHRLVADLRPPLSPRNYSPKPHALAAAVKPRRFQPPQHAPKPFTLGSNALRDSASSQARDNGAAVTFAGRDVPVEELEEASLSVERVSREQKPRLDALHNEIRQHKDRESNPFRERRKLVDPGERDKKELPTLPKNQSDDDTRKERNEIGTEERSLGRVSTSNGNNDERSVKPIERSSSHNAQRNNVTRIPRAQHAAVQARIPGSWTRTRAEDADGDKRNDDDSESMEPMDRNSGRVATGYSSLRQSEENTTLPRKNDEDEVLVMPLSPRVSDRQAPERELTRKASHNPNTSDGQEASTEEAPQPRPSKRLPRPQPGATGGSTPSPNSRDPNSASNASVPAPRRRNPTETEAPERLPVRESNFKSPVSPRAVPTHWAKNKTEAPKPEAAPMTPPLPTLPLSTARAHENDTSPSPRDAPSESSSARDMPSPHRTASPRGNVERERLQGERERIERERREERERLEREREKEREKVKQAEKEEVDTFENYKMVSCGLCKLTFEECDTVVIKEVSRSFCHKCSNDVIERAKLKGLTLTKV